MMLVLRKFIAAIATVGLVASIAAYIGSFFGLTAGPVSHAQPWLFYFFAGVFVTVIPFSLAEYNGTLPDQQLFFKRFSETRPPWALRAIRISFAVAMAHMALFLFRTQGSTPDIVGGEFVLRGKGVISEAHYLSLAGWETRFFASFMICIYLYMALYWWFPRVKRKPGPYDDYQPSR